MSNETYASQSLKDTNKTYNDIWCDVLFEITMRGLSLDQKAIEDEVNNSKQSNLFITKFLATKSIPEPKDFVNCIVSISKIVDKGLNGCSYALLMLFSRWEREVCFILSNEHGIAYLKDDKQKELLINALSQLAITFKKEKPLPVYILVLGLITTITIGYLIGCLLSLSFDIRTWNWFSRLVLCLGVMLGFSHAGQLLFSRGSYYKI